MDACKSQGSQYHSGHPLDALGNSNSSFSNLLLRQVLRFSHYFLLPCKCYIKYLMYIISAGAYNHSEENLIIFILQMQKQILSN